MTQTRNDQIDVSLQLLALSAQKHSCSSLERQLALNSLVNGIVQSGKLCHPQKSDFSAIFYQDIYDEALQELLLYVCQNIDKYEPARGPVMAWVNFLLERRFFRDAVRKIMIHQNVSKMTMTDLDNFASPEEPEDLAEILKQCIELDPEDMFKKEHVEKYPQANFQALAQRRIKGKSWKEIAAEFDLKIPTLSSFYYRCVIKFAEKIKTYCRDYGI